MRALTIAFALDPSVKDIAHAEDLARQAVPDAPASRERAIGTIALLAHPVIEEERLVDCVGQQRRVRRWE
jgi:hypothetical protein